MMNNCAPRTVLEGIAKRFGSVFASISPDYNFCFRCLEVVDAILYYDAAAYAKLRHPAQQWRFGRWISDAGHAGF